MSIFVLSVDDFMEALKLDGFFEALKDFVDLSVIPIVEVGSTMHKAFAKNYIGHRHVVDQVDQWHDTLGRDSWILMMHTVFGTPSKSLKTAYRKWGTPAGDTQRELLQAYGTQLLTAAGDSEDYIYCVPAWVFSVISMSSLIEVAKGPRGPELRSFLRVWAAKSRRGIGPGEVPKEKQGALAGYMWLKELFEIGAAHGGNESFDIAKSYTRASRVFEIPVDYIHGFREMFVGTLLNDDDEDLAFEDFRDQLDDLQIEDLPFDSTYFALSEPCEVDGAIQTVFTNTYDLAVQEEVSKPRLRGYLVGWSGYVWAVYDGVNSDGFPETMIANIRKPKTGWLTMEFFDPWVVCALIRLVRYYKDLSQSTNVPRRIRRQLCSQGHSAGHIPKKYYTVLLRNKLLRPVVDWVTGGSRERGEGSDHGHAGPSYRHDVRDHDRVLVQRATDKDFRELAHYQTDLGYDVFGFGQLPEHLRAAFRKRGMPLPSTGEWVAVKVVQVVAHIRGPEGAPYVPAIRKLDSRDMPSPEAVFGKKEKPK